MSIPSMDPANLGTVKGAFKTILRKFIESIDGCIPARVIEYDKPTNRAQVQPLIQLLDTSNRPYSRGQIDKVSVLQLGGGGFTIYFPVKTGDLGLLIAMDRDISIFMQSMQESKPQTFRVKNFADGIFIPGRLITDGVSDEDEDNLVIQSNDGTIKISLSMENGIIIQAPPGVNIITDEANITAPTVNLIASEMVLATTPLLAVSGNITAGGSISPMTPPPPEEI